VGTITGSLLTQGEPNVQQRPHLGDVLLAADEERAE
jgi:hypothetical protein